MLQHETDNLRGALDWASLGRAHDEAQIIGAVAHYWMNIGRGSEAGERLMGAFARHRSADRARVRAVTYLGEFLMFEGSNQDALELFEEAQRVARECGDILGEALAVEEIGLALSDDQPEAARLALEKSLWIRRQAGAPPELEAQSLFGLCGLLLGEGNVEAAEAMVTQLLELGERHGDREQTQQALRTLADARLLTVDPDEAERRYRRALDQASRTQLTRAVTVSLLGLAASLAAQGKYAEAVRLATAARKQRRAYGLRAVSPVAWWQKLLERHISAAQTSLSPAELEAAERAGAVADFEALVEEALVRSAHSAPVRDSSHVSASEHVRTN